MPEGPFLEGGQHDCLGLVHCGGGNAVPGRQVRANVGRSHPSAVRSHGERENAQLVRGLDSGGRLTRIRAHVPPDEEAS